MTDKQKQAADFIIKYYKDRDGITINKTTIINAIDQNVFTLSDIRYVLHFLSFKGLLQATDGVNQETLFLTDKGWAYQSFDKLLADEKRKNELEEALIISSIASNKSVKYVNKLFWLTAIFAFLSAIGTLGSFILELCKKSPQTSPKILQQQKDTVRQNITIQYVPDSLKKR